MRHRLALARVFRTVTRVEQPAANRDKRVVVLALEEAIAVAIDVRDSVCVCDADMVRLDAHQGAVFLVCFVHSEITLSASYLEKEPEVCPGGGKGRGDGPDLPAAEVGQEVEEDGDEEDGVGREEKRG